MELHLQNIRTDSLKNLYQPFAIVADVLRLDLVHPVISGNKWFKLQGYLKEAQSRGKQTVITFGGAYSNHIVATAAACAAAGLRSVGIIRGEVPENLSPTLQEAGRFGMDIHFSCRQDYALKKIPDAVQDNYSLSDSCLIAEGGFGIKGAEGIAAIMKENLPGYSHILTAVGTGTTLAGLVIAASPEQKVLGVSALKGAFGLVNNINSLLPLPLQKGFTLLPNFHFGGYAKHTPELLHFMNNWFAQTGIPSDFVYTGKLFFAVDQLIRTGAFEQGGKLLIIHSGGLQGNRSLPEGTLIF